MPKRSRCDGLSRTPAECAERVRRTAAEVPAEQRSAMAIALAQIGAAFDAAAVANAFKIRVEHLIRLGP